MSMCILQNYLKIIKNIFLGRSHMGTLGDKTSVALLQVAPRARALLVIP